MLWCVYTCWSVCHVKHVSFLCDENMQNFSLSYFLLCTAFLLLTLLWELAFSISLKIYPGMGFEPGGKGTHIPYFVDLDNCEPTFPRALLSHVTLFKTPGL